MTSPFLFLQAQRRLHQIPPVSLSLSALHSVFLSGLTLLHCMHLNRRIVTPALGNRAIRACSNTLFLYAQHFVAAEPFRDAFEDLANACLDDDSDMDTMGGPMPIVVESKRETTLQDEGTSIPLWGSQLDDMSKLMTEGQRDSFYVRDSFEEITAASRFMYIYFRLWFVHSGFQRPRPIRQWI